MHAQKSAIFQFFIGLAEMWDAKLLTMIILMAKSRDIFLVVCFLLVHAPVQCHGHQGHHPEGSVCTAMTGIEKIEEGNF